MDEFVALANKMSKDGTPVAFCDKDGWPAMGTFDYINMRLNGYDFHKSLMAGEEAVDEMGELDDELEAEEESIQHAEPGTVIAEAHPPSIVGG